MRRTCLRLLLGLIAFCEATIVAQEPYKFSNEIPIGGEGGWDILTIDSAARRLYLSHATKVVVVDIDANKVIGEISDTPGVHAFVPVPELHRGFSSNGKENKSSVVDLQTLGTTRKLDTGNSPDAIAYDMKRGEVYVFNHRGNSATLIDAKAANVLSTIPLDGNPEFGVADSAAGRIYCNIEDKSEVAVIDAAKHETIANWPVAPGEEPSGIALDAEHHRLFATCKKLMVMLDQARRIDQICSAESIKNVLDRYICGQQARGFRRDLELRNSATLNDYRRDAVQPIKARLQVIGGDFPQSVLRHSIRRQAVADNGEGCKGQTMCF